MFAYLTLLRARPAPLIFGFGACFTASLGQTFFIAIFGEALREAFGLDNAGFGILYSIGTLGSAAVLIWLGRLVDRVRPGPLLAGIGCGLAFAGLLLTIADHWAVLLVALFGLRLCGQGMMIHIALTTMARCFDADRGKAVSFALLGVAAGEIVFPLLALGALEIGWRAGWAIIAVGCGLGSLALARMLPGSDIRTVEATGASVEDDTDDWQRRDVLRDVRFYLLLPGLLALPMILTGVFFHQTAIMAARAWPLAWFASGMTAYAVCAVLGSLAGGVLVDRHGARRTLPLWLPISGAALLILALAPAAPFVVLFLALAGFSQSGQATTVNALWPELYGTRWLGEIRSLATALMVFGSALSPAVFGWLLDLGIGPAGIAVGSSIYIGASTALYVLALRDHPAAIARHRGSGG